MNDQEEKPSSVYHQWTAGAILRNACGSYPPGTRVNISTDDANKTDDAAVLVWVQSPFWNNQWCSAGNLLLMKHYLKRRPLNDYWALVVKTETDTEWVDYLACVDPPEDGSVPFHFESEGELRYYAEVNKLDMKKYLIAEFKSSWKLKPQIQVS